jgi:hypothetical protein
VDQEVLETLTHLLQQKWDPPNTGKSSGGNEPKEDDIEMEVKPQEFADWMQGADDLDDETKAKVAAWAKKDGSFQKAGFKKNRAGPYSG